MSKEKRLNLIELKISKIENYCKLMGNKVNFLYDKIEKLDSINDKLDKLLNINKNDSKEVAKTQSIKSNKNNLYINEPISNTQND